MDNATLPLSALSEGSVNIRLKNGNYKSKDEIPYTVKISATAFGDLNGDGVTDAAIITHASAGGSATVVSLSAMIATAGKPSVTEDVGLGDRTLIKAITIKDGKIVIKAIVNGGNAPLCCPTVKKTFVYRIQNGKLVGG